MVDKVKIKKTRRNNFEFDGTIALAVGIMFVMLLAINFSEARAEAKYNFRYPSWESPGSWHNENFYFWWTNRVEELSKGDVKFDLFPGQVLIKGANHYESTRDGIVSFSPGATSYEKDTLPLATIEELPYLIDVVGKDHNTYFKMHDEMLSAGLQAYYHKKGVHYIAGSLLEPYGIWTTKKWGPIRKLEDIKGCKVRTPGGVLNQTLVALDAIPVAISVVDMYTSLQSGIIDGVSLAEASQISHRSYEVVRYASRVNLGGPGIHIWANLKTWNELPQNIQDIMMQAGKDMRNHYAKAQSKYWNETTPAVLKKAGVELIEITPQERARLQAATESVRQNWVAKYGDAENGLVKKLLKVIYKYYPEK
ncbi:C4-dicarboxylate ABC transporter substrate-binding protein [Desulfosarcina widdelii]|uniref:C4-dicarboxylate ABC transporter substrate-binding protein n=1 Tax=Desulfosarcina widdelii TaxID=947919 RepID=A0A5K7ZEH9_9BACT|nr:TRAP transporter substrate-binding protein DctP [Desulfosarcina widdelii]BBO74617.1 C4-dicarboxylate ABC transporter substrate-binding protein [Desulfosarcina widdelii]